VAQTKKKRRTKHRGNAAGMVEARGRTGRKPDAPKGGKPRSKEEARQRRLERFTQPPTWRGALTRAIFATIFFGVVLVLLFERPVEQAVPLSAFMLLIYVPLGYFTDLFFYRRRMRKLGRTPVA
jgi:drug/metabolite transporter (DMT)-like permease